MIVKSVFPLNYSIKVSLILIPGLEDCAVSIRFLAKQTKMSDPPGFRRNRSKSVSHVSIDVASLQQRLSSGPPPSPRSKPPTQRRTSSAEFQPWRRGSLVVV
ncbi:hypothetical protein DPMN_179756 [Dreissena polymorpha]|uniref:Uncharacterized protein n=1 Tax=Dreissena polymorpha TaxID=45954 RepID=A0A9D4EGS2_DREPO|nr:hypothetical protein DPMN_179756 [Dreissena polymorpha]